MTRNQRPTPWVYTPASRTSNWFETDPSAFGSWSEQSSYTFSIDIDWTVYSVWPIDFTGLLLFPSTIASILQSNIRSETWWNETVEYDAVTEEITITSTNTTSSTYVEVQGTDGLIGAPWTVTAWVVESINRNTRASVSTTMTQRTNLSQYWRILSINWNFIKDINGNQIYALWWWITRTQR